MKVLRWQHAILESSKGLYRGSRLDLPVASRPKHSCSEIHENPWKSMKIYENQWKSMRINRKRWKSSDDKKPAWNRAKVSIGAAGPLLSPLGIHTPKYMKIQQNLWKSLETGQVSQRRNKTTTGSRRQEATVEARTGNYRGSRSLLKAPGTHTPKYMKIHQNL